MAGVKGTFWDGETKCQTGEACSGRRRPYNGEPEDFFEQIAALRAARGPDKYEHRVVIRRLWYGLYGGHHTLVRRPWHTRVVAVARQTIPQKERRRAEERKNFYT